MQAKNDLLKSFKKAAARAALAVVLTVGIVTPLVQSVADNPPPAPPAATQTTPATAPAVVEPAADSARTELSFERVSDLEALAKQYPVLANLPQEVKEADEQQGGDNPAFVEVTRHNANGREILFVHLTTPVLCSYEGCPLSVYMKDANHEFRKVLQVNAADPIEFVSTRDSMSVMLPGAYGTGPGLEFRYNAASDEFLLVTPAKPAAPELQVAPKPADTLQNKP